VETPLAALILLNSASPVCRRGCQRLLPYFDHFGIPYILWDINRAPLPANLGDYPLLVIAHAHIDPGGRRIGSLGRRRLIDAVKEGSGLVSFDPYWAAERFPISSYQVAETIEFPAAHPITASHPAGEAIALASPLRLPRLAAAPVETLVTAAGHPLLVAAQLGKGCLAQWATSAWMDSGILGPLAGLDGVLWRGLTWAARKPFVLRGLPPLVTMRVDDVAGTGARWDQSPLYWVHIANQLGLKPWLGLFLYNLTEPAIRELREFIQQCQASAFPHAFGRPNRSGESDFYYYPNALPLRADRYDEFIYFDHQRGRPWLTAEAARGLAAVDEWYDAHAPLPMSPYAIAHWGEMGSNVMAHVHDRWGADLIATYHGTDIPLEGASWLVGAPFRLYERPGSALFEVARRGTRPVYYADFFSFGERAFFNCFTEIRDDGGYEWAPDDDVRATIERGVRQLRRALDSLVLPVLFTHETDYLYKIPPAAWVDILAGVKAGISSENPIYVTMEDGVRYVRATRTARWQSCTYDTTSGGICANFAGEADVETHFQLYTAEEHLVAQRVAIPPFKGTVQVRWSRPT
jgi:hypothetical protein